MTRALLMGMALVALLAGTGRAGVLFQEDFEDTNLEARGWYDIHGWGSDKDMFIAGPPEVKANTGQGCLRIRYQLGDTGGWLHIGLKTPVPEAYVRYYRMFPPGWEWPKGYGPHDTILFAGSYGSPTNTDLSVYLDFWKTADTYVRVATARQKWGYGGYADVLRQKGGVANRLPYNIAQADKVEPGKWHCVEYYSKLSQPEKEDGIIRLWVNGELVSELTNLPLMDERHAGILFNHLIIGPYFHGGSHKAQWNYLDSLVISTEYIGTLEQAAQRESAKAKAPASSGKMAPPPGWAPGETK